MLKATHTEYYRTRCAIGDVLPSSLETGCMYFNLGNAYTMQKKVFKLFK